MLLSDLKKERRLRPPKIVIYSGPKAGKSTWASQAPNPIFIQTEEGLDALDVVAFPLATTFQQVLDSVKDLWEQDNSFGSIVIDSLDWLSPLITAHATAQYNADNPTKKVDSVTDLGFGRGYVLCNELWRSLLDGLDYLRNKKGMIVILISHSEKRTATPHDGDPYDFTDLKIQKGASALVQEWADCIAYATVKRVIKTSGEGMQKTTRAIDKGDRVLVVGRNPAYVTGNRYGLPDELPLNWADFQEAFQSI